MDEFRVVYDTNMGNEKCLQQTSVKDATCKLPYASFFRRKT
jgi:hypothetical protein